MKRALMALLVVAPGIGAGFYFSTQQKQSSYPGYDAMKSAGIFEAGWVPAALPPSTREFNARFDAETRKGVANFRYQPGDTDSLDAQCVLLASDTNTRRYGCDAPLATVQVELLSDGAGVLISDPKPPADTNQQGSDQQQLDPQQPDQEIHVEAPSASAG